MFYFGQNEVQLSAEETTKLQLECAADASKPRRRGRPPAHRSRDDRTFQSMEAFVFVEGEKRTFKIRHNLRQIPKRVQDRLIEFAKRICPLADDELILEHIRKDQRLLPHFDEPTSFLLFRHEYEDGDVANVIVAGPANDRLKRCT